jgi:O-antigen ligase
VFSLLRVDRTITSETTEPISISKKLTSEYISGSLQQISERRETAKVFLSFYINEDGYLDSWDATTSWRLDIWQDVFYDMVEDDLLFTGYAYNEIFPAMLDPTAPGRIGRDGLNEHIHNYFMNIFARGGFLQLALFAVFHYSIYLYWLQKYRNRQILIFIIPSYFVSALDITMEGAHYPFIYYIFLYIFLNKPSKV